jgi:hypothetical protein
MTSRLTSRGSGRLDFGGYRGFHRIYIRRECPCIFPWTTRRNILPHVRGGEVREGFTASMLRHSLEQGFFRLK